MDISAYSVFDPGGHVCVRTFKRDGTPVATPLWFVEWEGKLYARTFAGSAKTKRLRNNQNIEVADCKFDGEITSPWRKASAQLLAEDDSIIARVDTLADEKYGDARTKMTALMTEWQKQAAWIEILENS